MIDVLKAGISLFETTLPIDHVYSFGEDYLAASLCDRFNSHLRVRIEVL